MKLTEQTDWSPLFSGDLQTINTTLNRYGKSVQLGDFLNISGITDSTVRRYLMHQAGMSIRKTNLYDPTQNFMSALRYMGFVSSTTTQAYKVGYEVYERTQKYITGATVTAASNSAIKIVLPAGLSLASGIIADIDTVLELGETRFQVRVVGVDNGSGDGLNNLGVTSANVAMAAGAVGGTTVANVLIAMPLTTQTAPTILTTDKLFFCGNSKAERSDVSNALLQTYPNIYESGFTIADAHIDFSGTAGSTAVNLGIPNARGGKTQVMVSSLDIQLEEEINNRLISAVMFGQKETNTSVLSTSRQTRNSNGIVTSVAVNGGTIIGTTPGSLTFANTIDPIVDFCISKGIKSGKMFVGSSLYKDLQSSTATIPSSWVSNAQIAPVFNDKNTMEFQFTTNVIDWRGVRIELIPFNMFTDNNQWGIGYNNTGLFIPNKMTTVKNTKTDEMITVPAVQVLFKKDQNGRVRDETYETYDGGAGSPSIGTGDYAVKRRLPEFTVVSPLAAECVLVQPKPASYFV